MIVAARCFIAGGIIATTACAPAPTPPTPTPTPRPTPPQVAVVAPLVDASAPIPPTPQPPPASPPWAEGSMIERLEALRVSDDNWARHAHVLYSWTTRAQLDALRKDRTLLTAKATTNGPPSPFVWILESLSHRKNSVGAVAKLLASSPRFSSRRYAWTVGYATVLGLSLRRYGDQLIRIQLKDDAWVVAIVPEQNPPLVVRDLEENEIPLERVIADPEKVAAVYHVRLGRDVPARFREYVVVNEPMVARWSVNTPNIADEVAAEERLLHDLGVALSSPDAATMLGPSIGVTMPTWKVPTPSGTLRQQWQGTQAFDNIRYSVLDAKHIDVIHEGLRSVDTTQAPIEIITP